MRITKPLIILVLTTISFSGCSIGKPNYMKPRWRYPGQNTRVIGFLADKNVTVGPSDSIRVATVLKSMEEQTGCTIVKHSSIPDDPEIAYWARDLPLFMALDWLAGAAGLVWGVKDGTIFVGRDLEEMDFLGWDYSSHGSSDND